MTGAPPGDLESTIMKPFFSRSTLSMLAAAAGIVLCLPRAEAATITVTPDAVGTIENGDCSLSEAIAAANTNAEVDVCQAGDDSDGGGDVIVLPADGQFTIQGQHPDFAGSGLPPIDSVVAIHGRGTTVSRASMETFSLFTVGAGGDLTIDHVNLTNATASGSGPAIRSSGAFTMADSTVSNFQGQGGIVAIGGATTIVRSTIAGNTESSMVGAGGGIHATGGSTSIENTTIAGNATSGGPIQGAGLLQDGGGIATISYSTVSDNAGQGILGAIVGGIASAASTVNVSNSIVSGNTFAGAPADCGGLLIVASEANISSDGSCAGFSLPSIGALLGVLGANGGSNWSMVPTAGSPAIDSATGSCPSSDQRGYPRGPACDIGAVESGPVLSSSVPEILFGNVVPGTATNRKVKLTNSGTSDLHVTSVSMDDGVAEWQEFAVRQNLCANATVAPGGSCTFLVRFTPDWVGVRRAHLTVWSDAPSGPMGMDVRGTAPGSALSASKARMQWQGVAVGTRGATKTLVLRNAGSKAIQVAGVSVDNASFKLDWSDCTEIAGKGSCDVQVTFKPTSAGSNEGWLTVQSDSDFSGVLTQLVGDGL